MKDITCSLREIAYLSAHHSVIHAIAYSEQLSLLATAGRDHVINLWHITTSSAAFVSSLEGHLGDVLSLTVSQDGNILFSGAADNRVKLWDLQNHHYIRDIMVSHFLNPHRGDVVFLTTDLKHGQLLSVCLDGSLRVFQVNETVQQRKYDFLELDDLLSEKPLPETNNSLVFDDLIAEFVLASVVRVVLSSVVGSDHSLRVLPFFSASWRCF